MKSSGTDRDIPEGLPSLDTEPVHPGIRLAVHAMATRFELVLPGGDPVRLRAAGDEAMAEIERLDAQLNLYRPGSDIWRINQAAAAGPVKVEPRLFDLLARAVELSKLTLGAFDITAAPILRAWGFMGGELRVPPPGLLEAARASTGSEALILDRETLTVRFGKPGMMIDLGSIGKGYALDVAMDTLIEAGISDALIHGGTSSIRALGRSWDGGPWKVALPGFPEALGGPNPVDEPAGKDRMIELRDTSLSVSGSWGKSFQEGARRHGHVIDPRTGGAVEGWVMAAVMTPLATESDAFSTALLIMEEDGGGCLRRCRPGLSAWRERWEAPRPSPN